MMEKDLKLAQALAKGLINSQKNSRSNSPAGGDPDGTLNTDASMVLDRLVGIGYNLYPDTDTDTRSRSVSVSRYNF